MRLKGKITTFCETNAEGITQDEYMKSLKMGYSVVKEINSELTVLGLKR